MEEEPAVRRRARGARRSKDPRTTHLGAREALVAHGDEGVAGANRDLHGAILVREHTVAGEEQDLRARRAGASKAVARDPPCLSPSVAFALPRVSAAGGPVRRPTHLASSALELADLGGELGGALMPQGAGVRRDRLVRDRLHRRLGPLRVERGRHRACALRLLGAHEQSARDGLHARLEHVRPQQVHGGDSREKRRSAARRKPFSPSSPERSQARPTVPPPHRTAPTPHLDPFSPADTHVSSTTRPPPPLQSDRLPRAISLLLCRSCPLLPRLACSP